MEVLRPESGKISWIEHTWLHSVLARFPLSVLLDFLRRATSRPSTSLNSFRYQTPFLPISHPWLLQWDYAKRGRFRVWRHCQSGCVPWLAIPKEWIRINGNQLILHSSSSTLSWHLFFFYTLSYSLPLVVPSRNKRTSLPVTWSAMVSCTELRLEIWGVQLAVNIPVFECSMVSILCCLLLRNWCTACRMSGLDCSRARKKKVRRDDAGGGWRSKPGWVDGERRESRGDLREEWTPLTLLCVYRRNRLSCGNL